MLVRSIGQLATAAVHILNNSPASNQHNIERHGAGFTVYVLSLYSRPANAEPCRSQRRCTRLNIHFRFTAGRNRPAIPAFLPPSAHRVCKVMPLIPPAVMLKPVFIRFLPVLRIPAQHSVGRRQKVRASENGGCGVLHN